jgi:hypothetical protein
MHCCGTTCCPNSELCAFTGGEQTCCPADQVARYHGRKFCCPINLVPKNGMCCPPKGDCLCDGETCLPGTYCVGGHCLAV